MHIDYGIEVTSCKPLPEYKLAVTCSDGAQGIFDMKPYLDKGIFTSLQDIKFNNVKLMFGVPTWENGADIAAERVRSDMRILSA